MYVPREGLRLREEIVKNTHEIDLLRLNPHVLIDTFPNTVVRGIFSGLNQPHRHTRSHFQIISPLQLTPSPCNLVLLGDLCNQQVEYILSE